MCTQTSGRYEPVVARGWWTLNESGARHAVWLERVCGSTRRHGSAGHRTETSDGVHNRGDRVPQFSFVIAGRIQDKVGSSSVLARRGRAGEPGLLPLLVHNQPGRTCSCALE